MPHDPMVPARTSVYRTGPLSMEQVGELETLLREGALIEITAPGDAKNKMETINADS